MNLLKVPFHRVTGVPVVKVSHKFSARLDDDNLIGAARLVPVMALAESAGLSDEAMCASRCRPRRARTQM